MREKKIDGFGILLSNDPEDDGPGKMLDLEERHIGQKFALRKHPRDKMWWAIGYEGTYGRKGIEWEITSEL